MEEETSSLRWVQKGMRYIATLLYFVMHKEDVVFLAASKDVGKFYFLRLAGGLGSTTDIPK